MGLLSGAVQRMVQHLREVISNILNASEQLASSSEELSVAQTCLIPLRCNPQFTNHTGRIERLSDSINTNSTNAQKNESSHTGNRRKAEEGGAAVLDMVNAMKQIGIKLESFTISPTRQFVSP